MILAAIVSAAIGAALLVVGAARRNPGGKRLCPRCQYNLSTTVQRRCPECGYAWKSGTELYQRHVRRWRQIAGTFGLVIALGLVLFSLRNWTRYVPRPVLSLALTLLVDDQPVAPGSQLPAPNKALKHSGSGWERLVWQQQAAMTVERFLDLVARSDGSLMDIERLVPAAIDANEIYGEVGGTFAEEAWPMKRVRERARERRTSIDAQFALPLGTWAASELQYFAGGSDSYPDWLEPALEVHALLSYSTDARIRRYALERLAMIPAAEASAAIERMAAEDPDPTVRAEATSTLRWRHDIRGWR